MFDLGGFLTLLEEAERKKRPLASQPGFGGKADGIRERGRPPVTDNGRPESGGRPWTGPTPQTAPFDDEMRRRPGSGSGGRMATSGPVGQRNQDGAAASANALSDKPVAFRQSIARGSQPAVVKLVSFAAGKTRVSKLLGYQSRDGELAVENEAGELVEGRDWIKALANDWAEEDGRKPSKDVLRLSLILSATEDLSHDAVEERLKSALAGHRIAWQVDVGGEGEGWRVELVISAARRRLDGEKRAGRIFDNRKSMRDLEARLKDAFGAEARVDVHGFSNGVEGVARALGQLQRAGRHTITAVRMDEAGAFVGQHEVGGERSIVDEARDWKRDLRSQQRRDVAHIVLSAKPGTPKDSFVGAARAMLASEFAGHRFLFTLHEDRNHLHVHAVVKMVSETGRRLHPKIEDLRRWRAVLAQEARERNIPMDAVSRFERANPPGFKMKDIRRVERGDASETVHRRVEAVRRQAVHIPTRPEGLRHAMASAASWSAHLQTAESDHQGPLDIMRHFQQRTLDAVLSGAAAATQQYSQKPSTAKEPEMADLQTMSSAFAEMETNLDIVAKNLPPERLAQFDGLRQKLKVSQTKMIEAQTAIEAKRGRIEGETWVQPVPQNFVGFVAEKRGEDIRYSQRAPEGRIGAVAFTDHGDRVEVSRSRDREAVLAALQLGAEKWGAVRVSGPDRYKTLIVELAAQHGFQLTNPELQDKLAAARERIARDRSEQANVMAGTMPAAKPSERPERDSQFAEGSRDEGAQTSMRDNARAPTTARAIDSGDRVRPAESDRASILAGMQLTAQKWDTIAVTGNDRQKAIAVELAAEHGFKISNPELQEKLAEARRHVEERRMKDEARVQAQVAFAEGCGGEKPPIDTGEKVKPADRDRASMLGAMRAASERWGAVAVNGSERDKTMAVDLAAEHGFRISNPELQEKLAAARAKAEERQEKERLRERKQTGFVDGSEAAPMVRRSDAEIAVALETVKEKTEDEAARERREARRSAKTGERPIDGGGDDHAYRMQAEGNAAARAERAIVQNPSKPIPTDVNQSPEIERQRLDQKALLSEKEANSKEKVQRQRPLQKQ